MLTKRKNSINIFISKSWKIE